MTLLLALTLAACGIGGPDLPPPQPVRDPDRPCLTFDGEPVALNDRNGPPHNHPTVDILADGDIAVAWQIGTSVVAVQRFSADLQPRIAEVTLPSGEERATHPQVLAVGQRTLVAWQLDRTGELLMAELVGETALPFSLRPADGERRAQYPDLAASPSGAVAATWFAGQQPSPAWQVAIDVGASPPPALDLPTSPDLDWGGPATMAWDPRGGFQVAWSEQRSRWWWWRESRLMWARIGEGPIQAHTLARGRGRWERTALAFADDGSAIVAWTEYPSTGRTWSSQLVHVRPDGTPGALLQPADRRATMIDAASAGRVAILGWQAPEGQRTAISLQPFDLRTGSPLCATASPHPPPRAEQARVNLAARLTPGGDVQGVAVWHGAGAPGESVVVWARTFRVSPPGTATP